MTFSSKAARQTRKLPEDVQLVLRALVLEIENDGPYRANWSHYGPLKNQKNRFHCHLLGGRPVYVACWQITDKGAKKVEVYYAGTHEGAPY